MSVDKRTEIERKAEAEFNELGVMKRDIERIRELGNFDAENPGENQCLTAMEHKLIGSTTAGWGYHPNQPEALVGGSTLDTINKVRQSANEKGNCTFLFRRDNDELIFVLVELLPLTEEVTNNEEAAATFRIIGAQTLLGKETAMPENAEEYFKKVMTQTQEEARSKQEI
jgi:hypothetical protein